MLDFPKKNRLITSLDFKSLFKQAAKKIVWPPFKLLYQHNQQEEARLGIVLSKYKARSAVMRNGIRRVIRESFRQQKNLLKGQNIIVLLAVECTSIDKKKLREQVDQLWRQLSPS